MEIIKNHIDRNRLLTTLFAGLTFLFVLLQFNILAPILPTIAQQYHQTLPHTSILSSIYLIGIALAYIPAGFLVDRYEPYRPMTVSLTISVVAIYVFANATDFNTLVMTRLIGGMAHSFVFLGCLRIVSNNCKTNKAFYIGLAITIGLIGGIISQYPFVTLKILVGWQNAMKLIAILGAFILVSFISYFRIEIKNTKAVLVKNQLSYQDFISVLKNRQNLLLGAYACFMDLPSIMLGAAWGNHFMIQHYHLSNHVASKIIPWMFIGLMLGSTLSGWLSEIFKNRKRIMLLAAFAITCTILLFGIKINNLIFIYIIIFVTGFLSGFQVLSYTCLSETNKPHHQSMALSYASIIIMGGNGLLIPLIGKSFLFIPILLLLNFFIFSILGKETYKNTLIGGDPNG